MVETSSFNSGEEVKPRRKKPLHKYPEELGAALAAAGKDVGMDNAKKEEKESNKRKSKEMEADFDKRIADYKHKQDMSELRVKLKNRAEEKKKAAFEERTKQSLAKTRKALERFDKRTTEILAEREKTKQKPSEEDEYESLEVSGGEEKKLEDDYESFEVSEVTPGKVITSEETQSVSGEINVKESTPFKGATNKHVISRAPQEAAGEAGKTKRFGIDMQPFKETWSDDAQDAYVKAYREYDPRFTNGKSDDLIAVTRPPFFSFGKAARELKRLYGVMVEARKNRNSEKDSKKIRENVAKSGVKFHNEGGLPSETREALISSGELDDAIERLENKKYAKK